MDQLNPSLLRPPHQPQRQATTALSPPASTGAKQPPDTTTKADRPWINLILLLATISSTTVFGALHYEGFVSNFGSSPTGPFVLWQGLWYSVTILAILGSHELGHYYACRYYRVNASLPYFLPAPFLTGTLGAFIRIRQPIQTKRMLFDIGVAGPIAGFVIAVPALFLGISLSRVLPLPEELTNSTLSLGEPLLFQFVAWLIWDTTPEGYTLNLHPVGFAAWFGLLATALNLFPIGQLDGGHISYATFGRHSTVITVISVIVVLALSIYSPSWILWGILMLIMLLTIGPRHPRTIDHHIPLDPTRKLIAIGALIMFVICYTPAPVSFLGE